MDFPACLVSALSGRRGGGEAEVDQSGGVQADAGRFLIRSSIERTMSGVAFFSRSLCDGFCYMQRAVTTMMFRAAESSDELLQRRAARLPSFRIALRRPGNVLIAFTASLTMIGPAYTKLKQGVPKRGGGLGAFPGSSQTGRHRSIVW